MTSPPPVPPVPPPTPTLPDERTGPTAQPPRPPWSAVREHFERLMELSGSARAAALAAVGDPALQAELRSLLSHHDAATVGVLSDGAPPLGGEPAIDDNRAGQRLGAWRIVERLGAGGMGDVWLAARDDGAFRGEAAIKVLKRGMDSAAVLARFALEQQALARLSHPHIARLLDAGRSDDGLPYFVMERVAGRPIDQACEGRSLAERLALFLQLADAVAHAHRHLLVHRDLKPSNVMVDGDGQVKLLDFGIAKALDPFEDGAADLTAAGARPFTPHFASPEQVRGEPVSTATDIYSLGVLLYVMLTGQRPYGRTASTPMEAARSVLEEEPTRPSSLSLPAPEWVHTRRQLQGDLDNILLKAMEKPVERRYPHVEALAADVRAYLQGYPVSARAAAPLYVAGKFVRRHRWAVLAGVLGGTGLIAGLGAALWQGRAMAALGATGLAAGLALALAQARQAAVARDEARRQLSGIKRVAGELVFRFGDTISLLPGGAAAQEAMCKEIVAALDQTLRQAPDDADLQVLVASALGRLAQLQGNPTFAGPGRAAEAEATIARALALADRAWGQRAGEWRFALQHIITLMTRAQLLRGRGEVAAGLDVLALAGERCAQALALRPSDEGRALLLEMSANVAINQAHFHDHAGRPSLGRPQEALAFLDRAEADLRTLYGTPALTQAHDRAATPGEPTAAFWGRHNLANVHAARALVMQRLGEDAAMRREIDAALALRALNLAEQPSSTLWRQTVMFDSHTLAIALLRAHEPAAALAAVDRAWSLATELHREAGAEGPWAESQAGFAATRAQALFANGLVAESLPLFEQGLAHLSGLRERADTTTVRQKLGALHAHRAQAFAALAALVPASADSTDSARAAAEARTSLELLGPLLDDASAGREARAAAALAQAVLALPAA